MQSKIRNVAVLTKYKNYRAEKAAGKIVSILANKGIEVFSLTDTPLKNTKKMDEKIRDKIDIVLAIGGDGTTLRAFRYMSNDIPVFSMNVGGTRGILSEIKTDLVESSINSLLKGQYLIDKRIRIQSFTKSQAFNPALNEILILRSNMTRTPKISIKFRDFHMEQLMDGLIVSTPTGSTGHSFSIGGPVLYEKLNCFILAPIASVNKIPQIVIPAEDIEIKSNDKIHMIIDGQETFMLDSGEDLKISKYTIDARFIRLKETTLHQLVTLGF